MGLDVSVYKNFTYLGNNEDVVEDYNFMAYVIDDEWTDRIKNLKRDGFYSGDNVHYGVGYSYSTHNRFREHLMRVIGRGDLLKDSGRIDWDKLANEPETPFFKLVYFADNEGCLDWEVSEELYNHFVKWEDEAIRVFTNEIQDKYYLQKYMDWKETFEVAKDKGVVVFH